MDLCQVCSITNGVDNSTDPSQMDIRVTFPSNSSNGTLIASAGYLPHIHVLMVVNVAAGSLVFSQELPTGFVSLKSSSNSSPNAQFQCTEVNKPTAILAQSGPVNILGGQNPFVTSVSGTAQTLAGSSISVFSAEAPTNSFPVSTITDALITTSFPTVATVVSSVVQSISTSSVLTTTSTEFSSLVNVTSTGSILLPLVEESITTTVTNDGNFLAPLQIPFVTYTLPPVIPLAHFKKWKRVADQSSIPLAAVTISGTRGATSSIPVTSTISQAATTISNPGTTIITTPPIQSTFTPPPVTVTLPPSVVTIPPTIITVTPTERQNFTASPPPVQPQPPIVITQTQLFPPPKQSPVIPPATTLTTTAKVNTTTAIIQPVDGTLCAICTSGLINGVSKGFGFNLREMVGWGVWIGIVGGLIIGGIP
jgi:hypothetical protein